MMSNDIVFYVNGQRHCPKNVHPTATLLQYLRAAGLTGTKLGCGEGGCGACTVTLASWDKAEQKVVYRSVNSCLFPVCGADGCAITTVEGLGNTRTGLHPTQERIAHSHGSQCGFCTPGIVMSMYTLLKSNPKPTEHDIEHYFDGNLCRCTGYRPILEAYRTFAIDGKCDPPLHSHDASECGKGNCGGTDCNPDKCSKNHDASTATSATVPITPVQAHHTPCEKDPSKCCENNGGTCKSKGPKDIEELYSPYRPELDPAFPDELKSYSFQNLKLDSPAGSLTNTTWFRPLTMQEFLDIKEKYPEARIVVGNTELAVEAKFKGAVFTVLLCPTHVPELNQIQFVLEKPNEARKFVSAHDVTSADAEHITALHVGAAVTLSRMEAAVEHVYKLLPQYKRYTFEGVLENLRWFAGQQIRNAGSVGSNVVTASPISDLNPVWQGAGATFVMLSKARGERPVHSEKFFLAYRKVDLGADEVLSRIELPVSRRFEYMRAFKQSRRRDDDIAICSAGLRAALDQSTCHGAAEGAGGDGRYVIADTHLSFGGVAPITLRCPKTEALLTGRSIFDDALIDEARALLAQEINLPLTAPGGQVEYRNTLACSFLYKFVMWMRALAIADAGSDPSGAVDPRVTSALPPYSRVVSKGLQHYKAPRDRTLMAGAIGKDHESIVSAVGQSIMHRSAEKQTTGEAQYCDDIPVSPDCLFAALVISDRSHANIKAINTEPAMQIPGVVRVFTYKDIPEGGSNWIGPIFHDEEVFCSKRVTSAGQVIALVVANEKERADAAAKLVKVEYEELPAVLSIQEAIEANQFYPQGLKAKANEHECLPADPVTVHSVNRSETAEKAMKPFIHAIHRGNVDEAMHTCHKTIEGVVRMGGQEHFYLETQATLAIPGEGEEMLVWASTQALAKTQSLVASTLGVDMNKIVCKVKRMGGGFGGKETRSCFVSAAVALGAYHLRKPVKIMLERDMDMLVTGTRHPFEAHYKAGITPDGRIVALDVKLYNNIGYSMDLSAPVMDRALFHVDNSYYFPNLRAEGKLCVTNIPTNTAFRGFGGPQGMIIAEQIIEHVATELGIPSHRIREKHMYNEGDLTHYGQAVENCQLRRIWNEVLQTSEFHKRLAAVDQFNKDNKWRKRGIAAVPTKYGISFTAKFMNQAGALVHVYNDGSVLLSHGGTEMGQGLNTKMAQICADSFGISLDKVYISETATDKVANTQPTAASASSDLNGMAILDACEQIKARLAPLYEKNPNATFAEIVSKAYFERINLSANGFYATPDLHFDFAVGTGRPFNYYTTGASVSEVEIDVLTGDHTVIRSDILMDLGTPINPAIDIGQIEGAFVQGQGLYTLEEIVFGDHQHKWIKQGALFTRGPSTYKPPGFQDIPIDFRVSLLSDASNPRAVHSTKAVGEPPLFLASSILFAIRHAILDARREHGVTGHFALDSPATCERIRMTCADTLARQFVPDTFRPIGFF